MPIDDRDEYPLDPYWGPPEPEDTPENDAWYAKRFAKNSVRFSEPPPAIPEIGDPDEFKQPAEPEDEVEW